MSLPLFPARHPSPGPGGRGRWVPRPPGQKGVRGGCLGGWVATRAGREVAAGGKRAALPGPGARRLPGREAAAAAAPRGSGAGLLPPLTPPWLPRGAC